MMHTSQIKASSKGYSKYFMHIENKIREADISIANMEFPLAGEPYSGYPTFSAPDEFASYVAGRGFDIFLCANNHIFDKGSEGAARTVSIYDELQKKYGFEYIGLANSPESQNQKCPLIITRKGIRVALINTTYGTNLGATDHWPKTVYQSYAIQLGKALSKAEAESDLTIALPHWGIEYELQHSESQETFAKWLIERGADAIIGTHPHVIQDTSAISGIPVAYSLGNLVSNMSAANTQLGLMVTMKIIRDAKGYIRTLPFELTYLWCSRPGGLTDGFTVIPVEEFIGRRDEWMGTWDYDKMIGTYEKVRKIHNNEH